MTQVRTTASLVRRHPHLALLAVLAIVVASLAIAARPAEGFHNNQGVCDDKPTGYECVQLTNKGTTGTVKVVGELFWKKAGNNIEIVINLHRDGEKNLADTGLSGEKLCIDDDDNPWAIQTSCLGQTAKTKFSSPGFTLAPPDGEGSAKYEYLLEGGALTKSETCFTGGAEVACPGTAGPYQKYTANIDGYSFLSFHFNQSLSIEGFFTTQPTIECGQTVSVSLGETSAAITRHQNTDGGACSPKPYTLQIQPGSAAPGDETILFDPDDVGAVQSAGYSAILVFEPYPESNPPTDQLVWDANEDDATDNFVPMVWCNDNDPFTTTAGGTTVNVNDIPAGEQGCIYQSIDEPFGDGTRIQTTWKVVFKGDPKWG